MDFHELLTKSNLAGYFGSILTITCTMSDIEAAAKLAGMFFGIMLTMISIWNAILKKRKLELEIIEKENQIYADKD